MMKVRAKNPRVNTREHGRVYYNFIFRLMLQKRSMQHWKVSIETRLQEQPKSLSMPPVSSAANLMKDRQKQKNQEWAEVTLDPECPTFSEPIFYP